MNVLGSASSFAPAGIGNSIGGQNLRTSSHQQQFPQQQFPQQQQQQQQFPQQQQQQQQFPQQQQQQQQQQRPQQQQQQQQRPQQQQQQQQQQRPQQQQQQQQRPQQQQQQQRKPNKTVLMLHPYMSKENLDELIANYKKYAMDIYKVNLNLEPSIDLKKIIYYFMDKINSSKTSKDLTQADLNTMTLNMVRDHIYEKYSHIFPSKDQLSLVHRDNQVNMKRLKPKVVQSQTDFRDIVAENNDSFINKKDMTSQFENISSARTFDTTSTKMSRENINFSSEVDKFIDPTDFDKKMEEIERMRNKEVDIIKEKSIGNGPPKMLTSDQLKNVEQFTSLDINQLKPTMGNEKSHIPINETSSSLPKQLNDIVETDKPVQNGFDFSGFDSDDEIDTNVQSTSNTSNKNFEQSNIYNENKTGTNISDLPQVTIDMLPHDLKLTDSIPALITTTPNFDDTKSNKNLQEILQLPLRSQKIVINSHSRDHIKYPSPFNYKIILKNPIKNINRITLSNVLISLPRYKGRGHMSYALLKINDYEVISSNDSVMQNCFSIIYPSMSNGDPLFKTYGDDQFISPIPISEITELNICICNYKGKTIKARNNNTENVSEEHLIELLIDYYGTE
jgi:hypothetical protein